ncbi:MAG: hypothetical protein U0W65_17470 [Bacteroidia bacterium]
MKKLIILLSILFGMNLFSQNTIPTTTCTGAMKINDSLSVNKDITALGDITSKGEVVATDTMRAQKDILIDGNAKVGGDLSIVGKSFFEQEITLKKGLLFDNLKGISYTPKSGPTPNKFSYGNKVSGIPETNCAAGPQPWANHQFGGILQIYDADPNTGDYVANSGLLNFQTWSGGSSIDASVGANTLFTGKLLLNYFCGNDVSICQGNYGGVVGMGKNVEMGNNVTRNISTVLNIGLPAGITKAVTVTDPSLNSTNKIVFEVSNTGKTSIGIGRPKVGGIAQNAMLSVDGLILAKEVRVAVSSQTHWADYVFAKEYKLRSLSEVKKYIDEFNHLPDVPSAKEVTEKGIDMLEMNATLLKKIEELTLYSIDLQKQLDAQKKEINLLKNK